ncbi:MAG: hypothetical protein ACE5GX_16715 [Thermoanaerobaculia bacterium]
MSSESPFSSRPGLALRAAALCLVASLACGAEPADADIEPEAWNRLESESFRMTSNGDPEWSAQILVDIELFRRSFEQLAPGIDAGFPIPTQIVAFKDAESYALFKTAADTASSRIMGQFLGHRDGNFITLNVDPRMSGGLGIIIHEYVHHIVTQNLPRVPRWLNEGLAEYYSTFEVEGRFAVIGRPVIRHLNWWRRNHEVEVVEVLGEPGADAHSIGNAGHYYAVSWAMAHYLLSTPGGADVLASYLEAMTLEADPADALLSALGLSAGELEDELRRHVGVGVLPTASLGLEELGPVEIRQGPSPPPATLTILGELAARLGDQRRAEQLFDLAIAYDPTHAEAIAGLASLRDEQARFEEAAVLHAQALAQGPRAARTFLRHGRHLLRRIEIERPMGADRAGRLAVQAKTSFLAALALDPKFAEIYAMLGRVHLFEGLEAADGLGFVERAHELLPTRADVVHTQIRLHLKLGAIDRATRLLDGSFRLLTDRETHARVGDEVRRAELLIAANDALADGRWDEGLELFDQAITYTADAAVRLQMEQQLENLERRADREKARAGGA